MRKTLGITARYRKARAAKDARYAAKIRAAVFARDGICRAWDLVFDDEGCRGVLEWAHLGEKRRARTRNMPPEQRHTTAGSLLLCSAHHRDYDQGRLRIIGVSADGPLEFSRV